MLNLNIKSNPQFTLNQTDANTNMNKVAPRNMPEKFVQEFTMNKQIPIYDWYIDETVQTSVAWDDAMMAEYTNKFTLKNLEDENVNLDGYCASHLIYKALGTVDNLSEKNVCIVGSQKPWIEFICLLKQVKSVTTVEYNPPVCNHPDIQIISYDEFVNSSQVYDIIISYSSIEHSGLGRYGDDIDPAGDLNAMEAFYNHLIPNGLLFLGVPVGKDAVVWNAHRIYGNIRLPILLKGFQELEWWGVNRNFIDTCSPDNNGPTPLILCQRM
jgi:hypothetical protein